MTHENMKKLMPDQIRLLTAEILFGLGIADVTKMPAVERHWLADALWMVAPNNVVSNHDDRTSGRVASALDAACKRTGLALDEDGLLAHGIGTLLGFRQPTPAAWLRPSAFIFNPYVGLRGCNLLVSEIDETGVVHFTDHAAMTVSAVHRRCCEASYDKSPAGLPCRECRAWFPDGAAVGAPCPSCERLRREKTMPRLMAQLGAKPEAAREAAVEPKLANGFITFIASPGGGYVQPETVLVHRATKRSFRVTVGGLYTNGQPCPIEEIDTFHPSLPPAGTVLNWDPPAGIGVEATIMADRLPEATGPTVTFDGITFKVKKLQPRTHGSCREMKVEMDGPFGGLGPEVFGALIKRFESEGSAEMKTEGAVFRAFATDWTMVTNSHHGTTITFREDTGDVSASSKGDHEHKMVALSGDLDVARKMLADLAGCVCLVVEIRKDDASDPVVLDESLSVWLQAYRGNLETIERAIASGPHKGEGGSVPKPTSYRSAGPEHRHTSYTVRGRACSATVLDADMLALGFNRSMVIVDQRLTTAAECRAAAIDKLRECAMRPTDS